MLLLPCSHTLPNTCLRMCSSQQSYHQIPSWAFEEEMRNWYHTQGIGQPPRINNGSCQQSCSLSQGLIQSSWTFASSLPSVSVNLGLTILNNFWPIQLDNIRTVAPQSPMPNLYRLACSTNATKHKQPTAFLPSARTQNTVLRSVFLLLYQLYASHEKRQYPICCRVRAFQTISETLGAIAQYNFSSSKDLLSYLRLN